MSCSNDLWVLVPTFSKGQSLKIVKESAVGAKKAATAEDDNWLLLYNLGLCTESQVRVDVFKLRENLECNTMSCAIVGISRMWKR